MGRVREAFIFRVFLSLRGELLHSSRTFRGDCRQKEKGGVCGTGNPNLWLVSKLNLVAFLSRYIWI